MAEMVADCPRCKAQKITFDLAGDARVPGEYESFSICRACRKSTVFQFTPKDSLINGRQDQSSAEATQGRSPTR